MAGLVRAIHVFRAAKTRDARIKPDQARAWRGGCGPCAQGCTSAHRRM